LRIYMGPMFAGKTTLLMKMFRENTETKLIIDYEPTPKCYEGFLINHDGDKIPAIQCQFLTHLQCVFEREGNLARGHDSLTIYNCYQHIVSPKLQPEMFEISEQLRHAQHIYINEAQFYTDLYPFVLSMLAQKKNVYLYGLDGDFQQKKMGQLLDLIPHCDEVRKLASRCNKCSEPAIYSKRITEHMEQYLPDENAYIPLCRLCFYSI
jgi:thymidine kinase